MRDEWQEKVDQLNKRIAELEHVASLHARFADLERNLDLRQQMRDQMKRGERGERGPRGETGAQGHPGRDGANGLVKTRLVGIKKWVVDPEDYSVRALMSDGPKRRKSICGRCLNDFRSKPAADCSSPAV
jgi:hypothetical protein